MRLSSITQGKDAVNHGLQRPILEQGPEPLPEEPRNLDLLRRRPRAQPRADDAQAAALHQPQINLRLAAAEKANEHQTAVRIQYLQIARKIIGAHRIQNQIDASGSG